MDKKVDIKILKREKRIRFIKAGVIIAIVIFIVWFIIRSLLPKIDESSLQFSITDTGPLPTTTPASGRIAPAFEEVITSPVESRIIKVYAKTGDSIQAGTPLIELDLTTTQTSYSKMLDQYEISRHELKQLQLSNRTLISELSMLAKVKQMQLNGLKLDLINERKLDSLGSGTGERVRQAETALASAALELAQHNERLANERQRCNAAEQIKTLEISSFKKDLELMRQTLERGRIPAPHTGVVTYVNNEIGSRIGAGERLAVVSDLSQFRIDGEVAEGSSAKVQAGARVRIRIGSRELLGIVNNIAPQSRNGMVNFTVDLDQPRDPSLRSGIRAELYVDFGYKDNAVRIANGPYFKGPGEYNLFVAGPDRKLTRRTIRLGDSNREYVEVVSGLSPGDRVVVSDMERYSGSKTIGLK